jgi:branched-chain amino acid transport system permease protein
LDETSSIQKNVRGLHLKVTQPATFHKSLSELLFGIHAGPFMTFDFALLAQYLLYGLIIGGMYGLMGAGLSLIWGVMDICNFAHGSLFMLGAYFAYLAFTVWGLDPVLSILTATVAVFVIGMIVEKSTLLPLRRKSREWLTAAYISTLGLSIALENIALAVWGGHRRGVPYYYIGVLDIFGIRVSFDRIAILAVSMAMMGAFWLIMEKTRTGRAIRSVAQDKEAAMLVGVEVDRIYTITVGLGSALAAAAGGLLLPIFLAYPTVGQDPIRRAFTVVILGGLGNVQGAFLAGLILGVAGALVTGYIGSGLEAILTFAVLIVLLLFRPTGLFGHAR